MDRGAVRSRSLKAGPGSSAIDPKGIFLSPSRIDHTPRSNGVLKPICGIQVLRILQANPHGGNMCAMPKAKKATKAKSATKAKKAPAKKVAAAKKPAKKVVKKVAKVAKKAGAKKAKPASKAPMKSSRAMSMRGCCCG